MSFPKPFYRWRPHPWHGLDAGPDAPQVVRAFIEITPFDTVKYEIDKETGYTFVDRPQRTSSQPPTLYGFIPRTFCGRRVGQLSDAAERADGDPLDICVVSERPIDRGEIVLLARVVGGLQMTDDGEADDKIIGVLENDPFWGTATDIRDLPPALIDRLQHYFSTYKLLPSPKPSADIARSYGASHALRVVEAALQDYADEFGAT